MRISDWSSDVCSSDLPFNLSVNEETGLLVDGANTPPMLMMGHDHQYVGSRIEALGYRGAKDLLAYLLDLEKAPSEGLQRVISKQIGIASGRGPVCKYVEISVVACYLKKTNK